jgi:hypothetical protein
MNACLFAVALAILGSPAEASQPSALEVAVSYFDGLTVDGPDRPWRATIRDPGGSTLTDSGKPMIGLSIPPAKLATLRATIEKERFFDLRSQYGDMVVDGPERAMEIRLGGRVKTVKIYSIPSTDSKKEAAEFDRVMKVWHAITDCLKLQGHAAA